MTANHELERRLADFYASEAPQRAPDRVLEGVLATSGITTQRGAVFRLPWTFGRMRATARVAVVVILMIAALAIGFALAGNRPPVPVLLPWTPDSLVEDWPAPVRPEPVGGGPIVPMALADDATWDSSRGIWDSFEYRDPVGDVSGDSFAWIDIKEVGLGPGNVTGIGLQLADDVPHPQANPADRWIAFGVVQDTNGDGAADVRIGIDNLPVSEHRAWRTDLPSGETKSAVGPPYGWVGTAQGGGGAGRFGLDSYYPGEGDQSGNRASLQYSVTFEELTRREAYAMYAWASMIEDGRVVATDYAPDVGWLVADQDQGIPLVGPDWVIERDFPNVSVVNRLSFTPDGQVLFEAGCNTGTASVVVDGATMQISDVSLTERDCRLELAEVEAEILAVLAAGDISYTQDAGVLVLRAGTNVLSLQGTFEAPGG